MGRIIVSENVSLDGVVQDPTGEEGFRHGGWFNQVGDKDREQWARAGLEEALGAEALLLGRRSDQWLAARWLSRAGERLFGETSGKQPMRLVHTQTVGDGLAYQRVRDA
jgi:hypothetical protein